MSSQWEARASGGNGTVLRVKQWSNKQEDGHGRDDVIDKKAGVRDGERHTKKEYLPCSEG